MCCGYVASPATSCYRLAPNEPYPSLVAAARAPDRSRWWALPRAPARLGASSARTCWPAASTASCYLVNPRHNSVLGRKAYRSLRSLDRPVDLAVICAPPAPCRDLADCRERARAAVVLSGAPAASPAAYLRWRTRNRGGRAAGRRVACSGPRASASCALARSQRDLRRECPRCRGRLALISQSGAIASAVLDFARAAGVGFRRSLALGAAVDVDFGEVLEFALVGFGDRRHRALRRIGSRCARVPVGAARGGAHQAGGRAQGGPRNAGRRIGEVALPTAIDPDRVFDAALRRAGTVRVQTYTQLFAAAVMLAPAVAAGSPARQPARHRHQRPRPGRDGGRSRRGYRRRAGARSRRRRIDGTGGVDAEQVRARATWSISRARQRRAQFATALQTLRRRSRRRRGAGAARLGARRARHRHRARGRGRGARRATSRCSRRGSARSIVPRRTPRSRRAGSSTSTRPRTPSRRSRFWPRTGATRNGCCRCRRRSPIRCCRIWPPPLRVRERAIAARRTRALARRDAGAPGGVRHHHADGAGDRRRLARARAARQLGFPVALEIRHRRSRDRADATTSERQPRCRRRSPSFAARVDVRSAASTSSCARSSCPRTIDAPPVRVGVHTDAVFGPVIAFGGAARRRARALAHAAAAQSHDLRSS